MSILDERIGTPREAHRVSSAEEYKRRALEVMRDVGIAMGSTEAPLLKDGQKLHAYVSAGWWVVKCPCGNAPAASHEWDIAVCFECGAVHTPLFPKEHADGEVELLKRPNRHKRNWFPHKSTHVVHGGETVASLRRENAREGVG